MYHDDPDYNFAEREGLLDASDEPEPIRIEYTIPMPSSILPLWLRVDTRRETLDGDIEIIWIDVYSDAEMDNVIAEVSPYELGAATLALIAAALPR